MRKWYMPCLAVLLFLGSVGVAFGDTLGNCVFNPTTNTLTVSEGPESSADHGGVDCNLKDIGLVNVGDNQFFSLVEPTPNSGKFPCSDRVDVTNNHVTLISDPRVPDQGLVCTGNRAQVPEVNLGSSLGFGADLGTGLIASQSCTGEGKNKSCITTPVDLVVISDQTADTPEPASITLLGTGLLTLAGLLRKRRKV